MLRLVLIIAIAAWSLGPIVVGFLTSLSPQTDVQAVPAHWLPSTLNFDGYRALLGSYQKQGGVVVTSETGSFLHAMFNSATLTLESVLVLLVLAVFAGYAFSRLHFRGRGMIFGGLIGTLVIPVFVLVVPLFRIMAELHLIGTQLGLILIYVTANAPLAVWLFYNYCREIPIETEHAALTDGCTRVQALIRVVLPQMTSGIAALAAIMMLSVWGEFLIPLLFAPTLATKPVTVLITEFFGKYTTNYPLIAAAGILALLPPALIAIFLNRYIRGMLTGWS
jgi:multiple sugar transport system permease protein